MAFSIHSPYLLIGDFPRKDGWLIHISVVKRQMGELLDVILPLLVVSKCAFSIPENSQVHAMILDGSLGYREIGKVITICPENDGEAPGLAKCLIAASSRFAGPDIPAAFHLGGCIYASPGEDQPRAKPGLIHRHTNTWPFKGIVSRPVLKTRKWLNKKYFKLLRLKNDARGNVYKGLNFAKWTDIQWCIIKQGKKHQCADDVGRDVGDRLRWQYQVQSAIAGKVALPKAVDLFEVNGDTYLIMEYVEGESYHNLISAIQQGIAWYALPQREQIVLAQLSLQVLEVLGGLHGLGYVHRDLSPVNFIVRPGNKIVAIDMELSYQVDERRPDPHFTLGTVGYMSPQQRAGKTPVLEDDVFGLGALFLRTFTGLSPARFDPGNPGALWESVNYFVRNRSMSSLICACLNGDPGSRPDLRTVEQGLQLYYTSILANKHIESLAATIAPQDDGLKETIGKAIHGLMTAPLLKDRTWYSKTTSELNPMANDLKSYSWHPGCYAGAAGMIYTLLIARETGYDHADTGALIATNYALARQHYEHADQQGNTGLYNGTSGFAVITAKMIRMGYLPENDENLRRVSSAFSSPYSLPGLAEGVAGQGLAMMKCAALLELPGLAARVPDMADFLISKQEKDGSWITPGIAYHPRAAKWLGLLNGVSGIAYFLMLYGFRYRDGQAQQAAGRALDWLLSQRQPYDKGYNWPVSSSDTTVDPWLENGFTGIAWLFIRAYDLLKEERFKTAACAALVHHPPDITSNYIGQANGLAGLAEVYLEAYAVFGDISWLDRARNIMTFLNYMYTPAANGGIYWVDGHGEWPEPGLMTGQAGLIHLLLRFQKPELVGFPLLSL